MKDMRKHLIAVLYIFAVALMFLKWLSFWGIEFSLIEIWQMSDEPVFLYGMIIAGLLCLFSLIRAETGGKKIELSVGFVVTAVLTAVFMIAAKKDSYDLGPLGPQFPPAPIAEMVLCAIGLVICLAGGNDAPAAVRAVPAAEPVAIAREPAPKEPASKDAEQPHARKRLNPVVRSCAEQHGNRKVPLEKGTLLLGRSSECKIVYKDGTPGVSGRHCAILWDPGRESFLVKDLNSTYGTYMENGKRLKPEKLYSLRPGESIYLGEKANKVRLEVE